MRFRLPWSKDHSKPDIEAAEKAERDSTERLEDAFDRWPEVISLHIALKTEKHRNHFADRWVEELKNHYGPGQPRP